MPKTALTLLCFFSLIPTTSSADIMYVLTPQQLMGHGVGDLKPKSCTVAALALQGSTQIPWLFLAAADHYTLWHASKVPYPKKHASDEIKAWKFYSAPPEDQDHGDLELLAYHVGGLRSITPEDSTSIPHGLKVQIAAEGRSSYMQTLSDAPVLDKCTLIGNKFLVFRSYRHVDNHTDGQSPYDVYEVYYNDLAENRPALTIRTKGSPY